MCQGQQPTVQVQRLVQVEFDKPKTILLRSQLLPVPVVIEWLSFDVYLSGTHCHQRLPIRRGGTPKYKINHPSAAMTYSSHVIMPSSQVA